MKKREVLLLLLCLLFLALALFSAGQLFLAWQEYMVSDQLYDDLSQYIQIDGTLPPLNIQPTKKPTVPADTAATSEPTGENTDPTESQPVESEPTETQPTEPEVEIVWPVVDFESLREINSDVVGWIYIPGTDINYPIVQGWDNDYYLYRLFDHTYNKAGSIFMDYRNDFKMQDENTILYGHHMRNQTMFAQIIQYTDQAFYDAYPVGMLLTPDGNYLIEFFSAYVTDTNSSAWKMQFSSGTDYFAWLSEVSRKSYFASDVYPTAYDRVLTLSTCTYEYDNARYVLHGVLRPAAPVVIHTEEGIDE